MIHPRALSIHEPRPPATEWVCTEHGPLVPGETTCPDCEVPDAGR